MIKLSDDSTLQVIAYLQHINADDSGNNTYESMLNVQSRTHISTHTLGCSHFNVIFHFLLHFWFFFLWCIYKRVVC